MKTIKNLETKAVKNINSVKGGDGGGRSRVLNVQGGTDTTVTVWP